MKFTVFRTTNLEQQTVEERKLSKVSVDSCALSQSQHITNTSVLEVGVYVKLKCQRSFYRKHTCFIINCVFWLDQQVVQKLLEASAQCLISFQNWQTDAKLLC